MKNCTASIVLLFFTLSSLAQYKFNSVDINAGAPNSSPSGFIVYNGKLLFAASTASYGTELWVSDGTVAGTNLLKDIYTGTFNSIPKGFILYNSKVYFFATDNVHGYELWVTDGTATGTQLVKDINTAANAGLNINVKLTAYNGKLYFNGVNTTYGDELWETDGTATGTKMVKDIYAGTLSGYPNYLTVYNGKLYFNADDGTNGKELWVSDGTATGTQMVKDIYSGSSSSDPQELTVANSKLFFSAINAAGRELWLSNGTDAGTILVKNTDGAASSGITTANMIEYDNKLFFVAANAISGTEVWVSDGTTTGTEILKDINPVSASSYPGVMKVFNNKLYFAANDGTNGTELWVTDGTAAGTQLFVGLIPGSQHGNPQLTHTAEYTNLLFFTANHPTLSGTHLYCTDGTTTGTKLVSNPALTQSNPLLNGNYELYAYKNSLYFVAKYTSSGNELWWVTDTVKFTGITSTPPKSSFSIYPNPGDGNYTIELKEFDYTDKYITVYDILGKEVYKCPITNPKFQITLNQPKGIYIVKLQLDDAVLTKRVVVE